MHLLKTAVYWIVLSYHTEGKVLDIVVVDMNYLDV